MLPDDGDELGPSLFGMKGSLFGWSVAINSVNDIVVGAYNSIYSDNPVYVGSAYIFKHNTTSGEWKRQVKFQPDELKGESNGPCVCVCFFVGGLLNFSVSWLCYCSFRFTDVVFFYFVFLSSIFVRF